MTVLDLIKRSMRLLGAINVGDNPTAEEAQDGLCALNAMTEAFALERLMLFTTAREVFPLSGLPVYSIGPSGAAWTASRPQYIDAAGLIVAQSGTSGPVELPLHVIRTNVEWARVRMKALASNMPTALYYQPDFPNGNVLVWPVGTDADQIALYVPLPIAQFTTLTQVISLPPGYARMLPYNLAVEMAPEFEREPSAVVFSIASDSKERVKRGNVIPNFRKMRADEFAGRGHGCFDPLIGEER